MNGFLLDTTVIIDWLRGHGPTVAWLEKAATSGNRLVLSPVTVAEVFAGTPPEQRPTRRKQLLPYDFEPFSFEAAATAGELHYTYRQLGRPIPLPDLLQAGLARHLGLVVATSYPVHVPDVRAVNPREAPATNGEEASR